MATTINILCIDQKLKFQTLPDIASGGVNEVKIDFLFCDKWNNLTKTAVFYQTEDAVYHQLLDEDNSCFVPWEVLRNPGFFYIGVFGSNEEKTRTSEIARCVIKQGAITEETAVPKPSPDIYAQILAKICGGYYIPSVEQIDATTIQISFVPSSDDLPLVEPTRITLPANTDEDVIVNIDKTYFAIDENKRLTLLDIAMSKVIGLTDALLNKVDKHDGSRLITETEAEKLEKLVICEDGSVSVSGITAGNIEGLAEWITAQAGIIEGLSQNNFTDALFEKLSCVEEGAQENVIENITVNGEAVEVVDKTANITINFNNITQNEGETLILNGGTAAT